MTSVSLFDEETPRSKPALRVVQEGEAQLEAMQQTIALLTGDLELAETEIKRLRRREKTLKKKVTSLLRDDVDFDIAYELFCYWQQVTGEKGIFDQTCQARIMKSLKILKRHYKDERDPDTLAVRHLAACFLGIARKGFIDPATKERHNRIGLVCEHGESLTKNLRRYYDYCRETGQTPVALPGASVVPSGVDPVTGEVL